MVGLSQALLSAGVLLAIRSDGGVAKIKSKPFGPVPPPINNKSDPLMLYKYVFLIH